jgi:hypothetical protein
MSGRTRDAAVDFSAFFVMVGRVYRSWRDRFWCETGAVGRASDPDRRTAWLVGSTSTLSASSFAPFTSTTYRGPADRHRSTGRASRIQCSPPALNVPRVAAPITPVVRPRSASLQQLPAQIPTNELEALAPESANASRGADQIRMCNYGLSRIASIILFIASRASIRILGLGLTNCRMT